MRGLSAPTSLANLEREGGQPRSGWGVGEVNTRALLYLGPPRNAAVVIYMNLITLILE